MTDWHIYPGEHLRFAQQEIYRQYGDVVSFPIKGKSLNKFGRVTTQSTSQHTVMELLGSEIEETYVTTNLIDSISSSSASDNGKVISVEGHTMDGSGNLTFVTQNVTCLGQSEATLGTPLARLTRMYVANGTFASPSTDAVGNIYGYDNTGVTLTGGVPSVEASVKCMISAGNNESLKCATSLSSTDYWIVPQITVSVLKATGAGVKADIDMLVRELGGVWRRRVAPMLLSSDTLPTYRRTYDPPLIIKPNSDIRLVVEASASGDDVTGTISGYLAQVIA